MSTSLSDLRTRVRDFIDESTAARWTNAELNRYINQGIYFVQGQIQQASDTYFTRVEVATAAAGTYELGLPSDIWGNKLRSLQFYEQSTVATGTPYRVEPGQMEWVYQNQDWSGTPLNYVLHAGYIKWAPLLQYTGTFRFVYQMKESAFATDGSDDSNNLAQIADEHADVIALYAAILAKQKVNADYRMLSDLFKTRLDQVMFDVQSTDPIVIPQVAID